MIQSIKKAIIKRFIKLGQYAIESIGGESKAHYISPKGLYSRSITENGLILQILHDEGNKYVIPLQKAIELNAGDVIITDDKSYIKFKFGDGIVEALSGEFTFNGARITSNGDVVTASGVSLDNHPHTQGVDSATNVQVPTDPPTPTE